MILSPPIEIAPTLLSAPLELAGNWGHMLPRSADLVVERMRGSCLDGVRLVSDRQPTRLRVDEHTSGPPAIWLHPDGSTMAWIIVDIGERAWSRSRVNRGFAVQRWPAMRRRQPWSATSMFKRSTAPELCRGGELVPPRGRWARCT
jgi:hypothetical protein